MQQKPIHRESSAAICPRGKTEVPVIVIKTAHDLLLQHSQSSPAAAHRFESFIEWVVCHGATKLEPTERVIACALAFESLNASDLLAFLESSSKTIRRGEAIHIAWERENRLYRRSLCAFTTLALTANVPGTVDWQMELAEFSTRLQQIYPGASALPSRKVLDAVLCDAMAWAYLHLPAACFAFVAGHLTLNLLPDSVRDREFGVRPVAITAANLEQSPTADPLAQVKDIALEVSFGDNTSTPKSSWIIQVMKDLVAGPAHGDSMRAADFISRDAFRKRLGVIGVVLARSGSPVDATLLSWEIFLFESGSVRLSNPKVGTIARYVHSATEPLHHALNAAPAAPADLNQTDWETIFKTLLDSEGCSSELRCALATFHYFLIDQFGIDPMPWLFTGVAENCAPSANRLWPAEIKNTYCLIDTHIEDSRMRESLKVMLAIGSGNKIRIGEVRSLRLCSIRSTPDSLEIEIAPRRTHHQGKSNSARRILDYTDAAERVCIEAWLKRRIDESAGHDDLLFGDPHNPAVGYRLGACQRLLNQMLRLASGDPRLAFHANRHTVIDDEVHSTLLAAAVHQPISAIHRIAAQAGHKFDFITLEAYFHRPEEPIRWWIDQAVGGYLTTVSAAAWLSRSQDSLRQGRHRSTNKTRYLFLRVQELAMSAFEPKRPRLDNTAALVHPKPRTKPFTSFYPLSRVLADISSGFTMAGIVSRNAASEAFVLQACRATANIAAELERGQRKQHPLLAAKANDQTCLTFARNAIERHHLHLSGKTDLHLENLFQFVASAEQITGELAGAAESWTICKQDDLISMSDAEAATSLIALLRAGEVPASNLILRVQVRDPFDKPAARQAVDGDEAVAARALIEKNFNVAVQIECVRARSNRPNTYLLLSRRRLHSGKPGASASCRMNRFHGLMFTLAVWQALSSAKA